MVNTAVGIPETGRRTSESAALRKDSYPDCGGQHAAVTQSLQDILFSFRRISLIDGKRSCFGNAVAVIEEVSHF